MNACDVETVREFLDSLLPMTLLDVRVECVKGPEGGLPRVGVTFTGEDVGLLVARHGELLLALEHLMTQALRLAPEEHDWISFDAGGFKAAREENLRRVASAAVAQVRSSGEAFHFAPMSSRERRLLHLMLADSGLATGSEGEAPRRHLVLRMRG